jgi:hypothetical protein
MIRIPCEPCLFAYHPAVQDLSRTAARVGLVIPHIMTVSAASTTLATTGGLATGLRSCRSSLSARGLHVPPQLSPSTTTTRQLIRVGGRTTCRESREASLLETPLQQPSPRRAVMLIDRLFRQLAGLLGLSRKTIDVWISKRRLDGSFRKRGNERATGQGDGHLVSVGGFPSLRNKKPAAAHFEGRGVTQQLLLL